jgi:hypothetical protein
MKLTGDMISYGWSGERANRIICGSILHCSHSLKYSKDRAVNLFSVKKTVCSSLHIQLEVQQSSTFLLHTGNTCINTTRTKSFTKKKSFRKSHVISTSFHLVRQQILNECDGKVVPVHAMKSYGGVEVYLHSYFSSTQEGDKR